MDSTAVCINKAYELTDNITPIKSDCGKNCNKKCCKGDNKNGMLLFPGEEEIFRDNANFSVFYDPRYESNVVICSGNCNRSERPLSCRIFPYFIYYDDKKKKLTVAPDVRALNFCPLLAENYDIERKFLRSLRISANKLSENNEIVEFLKNITQKLTDFNGLGV